MEDRDKESIGSPQATSLATFPMPSLDDKMLLKSINRECFWYRCVPLTLVSSAAYYYYNEQKGRPHNFMRYTGLAFLGYLVGKFSYLREGRRRLVESPSNSPFVVELRKNYNGLQQYSTPYNNSGDSFKSETSELDWTDPVSSEFLPDAPMLDPNQASPIHEPSNLGSHTITYEELRARNREIYEKTNNKRF